MYPFGSLPENLAAFADVLRREHAFAIGPGELRDAARAIEVAGIADERTVRDSLRPVLSRTVDEAAVFDRAFDAFFFPGPPGIAQRDLPPELHRRARRPSAPEIERDRSAVPPPPAAGVDAGAPRPIEGDLDGRSDGRRLTLDRAAYSPLEGEPPSRGPVLPGPDPAWHAAANAFVRRVHLGLSRRWRSAPSGQRFDLRRTLRRSIRTGGEPISVRWLRRPKRSPRFVLIIDGSRSMSGSAASALLLAVALASATMRVEVFTFSTALRRVTPDVRLAAAGTTVRLHDLGSAWGGGTGIGVSLRLFLQQFGGRLLGRSTLVLIASDGLDLGDTATLVGAVRELARRSAGVVWVNPLAETRGYEPTARGMAAALPHVIALTSIGSPAALFRLSRRLRLRV